MNKKFIDRHGKPLRKGDTVKLIDIPLGLFLGLTENEQNTLRAEIGNKHLIQSSDRHGKIRLEFYDAKGTLHTILISSTCVVRIPG
jgi:hypothetical protein